MFCNSDNTIPTFKDCAGKDCYNPATIELKIKFIKRSGLFCQSCTLELKAMDLIDEEGIDIDQRVGSSLNNKNDDQ